MQVFKIFGICRGFLYKIPVLFRVRHHAYDLGDSGTVLCYVHPIIQRYVACGDIPRGYELCREMTQKTDAMSIEEVGSSGIGANVKLGGLLVALNHHISSRACGY